VIFVDPSGRGKDETAWAVMKVLNGILYLLKVGHEVADPTNDLPNHCGFPQVKIACQDSGHSVRVLCPLAAHYTR
jgi:hypothetical protein